MSRKLEAAFLRKQLSRARDFEASSSPEGAAAFLAWARAARVPLKTLKPGSGEDLARLSEMIGGASVVALGEGVHCGAEPLEFRNRVLQYLVQHKGFTAIAIESGIVESTVVNDYVRGGPGTLSSVLANGLSWTFDELPQNRALIRWMREYNADPRNARKVNFYGFDVAGSPANTRVRRGVDTALLEALRYLDEFDPSAGKTFHARVDSLIKGLRFGIFRSGAEPGYESMDPPERDALTGSIADLITLFERSESTYIVASSEEAYARAYRAAVCARQVDSWLRQIPPGWRAPNEGSVMADAAVGPLMTAADVRDRAQADNLEWIIEREGAGGKILVFAHRYHLSMGAITSQFWGEHEQRKQQVAGTYLRRRLGERLLTIGNLVGGGELACGDFRQTLKRAPLGSFDGLAGEVGEPAYLLDLRSAPADVRKWLDQEHQLTNPPHSFQLAVGRAFDLLVYLDTVTPACSAGAQPVVVTQK